VDIKFPYASQGGGSILPFGQDKDATPQSANTWASCIPAVVIGLLGGYWLKILVENRRSNPDGGIVQNLTDSFTGTVRAAGLVNKDNSWIWITVLIVLLVLSAGLGYYFYRKSSSGERASVDLEAGLGR